MGVSGIKLSSSSVIVHGVHVPNEINIELVIFAISSIVEWLTVATNQIWSNCNLYHFILYGMVDCYSLVWNVRT